jgi:acyl dehydratase
VEIDSSMQGTRLEPLAATIEWRRMKNYAAAIDDNNPVYFDDLRAEGVRAHPMYAVAVTWPIMADIGRHLARAGLSQEIMATQVHYSEHLRFHRLMRDGDQLTVQGEVAAVLPHRAGAHLVLRLEARDQHNAPVFTEHIGGMLRGVQCRGGAAGAESLPAEPQAPAESAPMWEAAVHIDPLRPYVYDGCTDVVFPIHTSPAFARMVGLPGIILQGTATLALAVRELIKREAKGDPARLGAVGCSFAGMVLPDSSISVRLLGREKGPTGTRLFFEVLNAQGQTAVKHGHALLRP